MPVKTISTTYCHLLSLGLATSVTVGMMSAFPSQAAASGFTGAFDPNNWTLTNTNANGSVDTTNAATGSIVLTGGNNGSNLPGTTDWTIPIDSSRTGYVSFDWAYSTLDTPGFDSAGFLLNGVYMPLAVQDGDFSTAPVSVKVSIGDVFGFRAETLTNSDGPPVFTVYDFSAVSVPEPSMVLGLLAFVGLGVAVKRK